MPSHKSHRRVYVEPPRSNELPAGSPQEVQAAASGERRPNGQLTPGASTIPRLGGLA